MTAPRPPSFPAYRVVAVVVLIAGGIASALQYRQVTWREREWAEESFGRRAAYRQVLAREVFARYEDALFGLEGIFQAEGQVSAADFTRVADRWKGRIDGAPMFEWVPAGQAPAGGVVPDEGRARATPTFALGAEVGGGVGVALLRPVFRQGSGGVTFAGQVRAVARVRDVFESICARPPENSGLEMLLIDMSEPEPGRQVLGRWPVQGTAEAAEFRAGIFRELKVPFGQRDWRILCRPNPDWLAAQRTVAPLIRAGGVMAIAGLLAALAYLLGRRARMVEREAYDRTTELAESRRQLEGLLQALPGMSFRCDYDERMTVRFVSEGALGLTGWTAAEFTEGKVHFRDCIHPDDLARVREGTREALRQPREFELEYRIRTKTGEEKWVLSRGRCLAGEAGAAGKIEGLAIDITAQKKAEAARLGLERKLFEGQKLESLGLLASGIAHDFNNLLMAILGNASMARHALKPGDTTEAQWRTIESVAQRAAELCRQMLAYAGKGQFSAEPTDVSFLVEDMQPLVQGAIGTKPAPKLELGRGLPAALADGTQIRQAVINLVLNAVEATKNRGGEISLTTGVMFADKALLSNCAAGAGLPEGDYVFLEVADDGVGMTSEVMARMFDPFFTTKRTGRGLGLAAVLGIVRGHRGALWVRSAPGAGARFRILLPLAPKGGGSRPPVKAAMRSDGGTIRVLMIEDEEHVRSVTAGMLERLGCVVTAMRDGPAGVALFRENPEGFDLVMLDLVMPGLSGEQTLATLRMLNPEVRVLLTSGLGEGHVLGRLSTGPKLKFIAKPFTSEMLSGAVRELMG